MDERRARGTTNLRVGDVFPDFELPDHRKEPRRLSGYVQPGPMDEKLGFTDGHPLVLVFGRGFFCPRDQQHMRRLVEFQGELAVNFGRLVLVLMNPPRLQRVLHNLISNALCHTPVDGTICSRATGELIQVEVTDTGEGIEPEDLPLVFERSFRGEKLRTRQSTEYISGAGLGLAMAKGLVEAQGGTMSVESRLGHGARFHFTLRRT